VPHPCRDTKNHTMLSPDRHQGGLKTTNALAFTPPTQFDKPEFARKPLIRCVCGPLARACLLRVCMRQQEGCMCSLIATGFPLHLVLVRAHPNCCQLKRVCAICTAASSCRDTFYRKTNIAFPSGCDATTDQ
jgi:hypothetical protein